MEQLERTSIFLTDGKVKKKKKITRLVMFTFFFFLENSRLLSVFSLAYHTVTNVNNYI